MWSLQLPQQWGKSCPRHCPHSPPQVPPDLGSCCRCWWHQENKAPSSSKPTQRHLEFRAPNSLHALSLEEHPKALPLLKSPASYKSLGHTGAAVPHL